MPSSSEVDYLIETDETLREDSAAQKPEPPPKSSFSKSSFNLGLWGDDLAKRLHESRYVYATYGALDGLSNICSHWRFLFDLIYTASDVTSDDKLHDFLSSPGGMIIASIEALAVMVYATIGNYFDKDKEKQPFLRFLALTWPYLRDGFKGSKNAFKGIRATLNLSSFLSGTSLLPYVVPSALGFGLIAVTNRLLMRAMYSTRKDMMVNNKKEVLQKIQELNAVELTPEELDELGQALLKKLQEQSKAVKALAYVGASFGGFIDGLYLYVGIVTLLGISGLLWLGAPTAIFLISCSFLYGLTNIAIRVYEEYGYQKKIDISVARAELALTRKKYQQWGKRNKSDWFTCKELLRKQSNELNNLNVLSYQSALLLGMTHGLSAYGVLASLIFAASTITFLALQTLPPALLITIAITIASGLLLMAAFSVNALYRTYKQRQILSDKNEKIASILNDLVTPNTDIDSKLDDCFVTDQQPLFFYMELFEVGRSFFSGIGKGPKSVMTTFNALLERGEDGHYHFDIDSGIIFAFTSVSSVVYAFCLALRAYAKGFGKPPVDQVKENNDTPVSPNTPPQTRLKRSLSAPTVVNQSLFNPKNLVHRSSSDPAFNTASSPSSPF